MYPNLKLQLFRSAVRQNFLARELGMDESILSKIIHGYREPSPEQRQRLSVYLGVEEAWLFEKYENVAPARAAGNHGSSNGMKDDVT
ncbi:MAG TPA: helix-turn-helix transcriptional regulator [Candidatus Acidoferrum sp.]|nr:helix-turn-helix transcriptional regulator [Candidatus Acidoferrum sp.]